MDAEVPWSTLAHIWMSMGFLDGSMGPRLSTLHMVGVAFLSGGMERVCFQCEIFPSVALLRAGMGPSGFPVHMWVSVPFLSGIMSPQFVYLPHGAPRVFLLYTWGGVTFLSGGLGPRYAVRE